MKDTNKFAALAVGLILLVALASFASLDFFRRIENAAEERNQAGVALNHAQTLLGNLVDAETSLRGYLMTGDETFLATYAAARNRIPERLRALQDLAPGGETRKNLDALAPLVEAKLAIMADNVDLRRRGDWSPALANSELAPGRQLMNSIRAELGNVIRFEGNAVQQGEADVQWHMRNLFVLIVSAGLLTILLALFFAYLIYRESLQGARNLLHAETDRQFAAQNATNRELLIANSVLHLSEERLAVTINSIDDAVIATDSKGRVTLLNPLAEQLTGWTRAEAVGQPVENIFHIIRADTRERYPVPVMETLAHGTTLSLANHTIVIARDGSECDIADSCAPIRDRDGLVVGAVLVFRDVTERKRLDKELQDKNTELEVARAEADKSNLAKSDFLSSMSHELRTPLNAILGFAQLVESSTPAPTAAHKRNVEQILKAGWYLLELINEILDLALIESGKLTLSAEPVSLADVMQECRAMIEPQAQKRGVGMAFPQFGSPTYVLADRTRVKQVLINLLSNAVKYNRPGGTVSVEFAAGTPDSMRISVRDTGEGLAATNLARLFEPFNRLGKEAGGEEGTGIGLVMTKRLMELMGGRIGADSTIGVGSVFWIEFRAAAAPERDLIKAEIAAITRPPAPAGTPLRTLLYVEDNPANLELVEKIIGRRSELRLLSAVNAKQGIEIARSQKPEVILMDINLPGVSGIEAMQILHADPSTAHIPVIAVSANAMPRDVAKGLEAGFFDYVTKPIKVREFMDALDVALVFAKKASRPAGPATQEIEEIA